MGLIFFFQPCKLSTTTMSTTTTMYPRRSPQTWISPPNHSMFIQMFDSFEGIIIAVQVIRAWTPNLRLNALDLYNSKCQHYVLHSKKAHL